ncbi:MAG: thioredoxin domain-containing protein [Minisyncoccia bacterium]
MSLATLGANESIGSPQAPIKVEVFADFECPQCRVFYLTTARQLIDNYVSSGKVYLIHINFPLSMHPYSKDAARWSSAAAAVSARDYEAVELALYEKQDVWAANGQVEAVVAGALSPEDMKKVRAIEMNDRSELDAYIAHDLALGVSRHVDGTPTIFVTHAGQTTPLPTGGVSYDLLKQYLDYLLKH